MSESDLHRFRLLTHATGDSICDWDIVHDRSWLSDRWQERFGPIDADRLDTAMWLSLVHPDDRLRIKRELEDALAGNAGHWAGEFRFRCADGRYAHILERALILRDDTGRATRMIAAMTDLTQQKQTEEALRESRRQLATLMSNLPGMAYRCGNEPSWRMTFVSEGALALTGYPPEALLPGGGIEYVDLIHPEDRDRVWRQVQLALRGEQPFTMTYRILTADGQIRWCWEQGRGVVDAVTGEPLIEGFITDVTTTWSAEQALRESEEHYRQLAESNRRLLAEVNHRVRNNLASLRSLIHMARDAPSSEAFADALDRRVSAMAQVHGLLVEVAWRDLDLRSLIESMRQAHPAAAGNNGGLNLSGPDVQITPRQSIPLAMTLMELMTNAGKHGAMRTEDGRVDVAWQLSDAVLRIQWRETAGPPVEPPIQPSLGTELIEGFIRYELGGRCELRYPRSGADHLLEIPLPTAPSH